MNASELKAGIIVRGPVLPEPIEVLVVTPLGDVIKIVGAGQKTGQVHQRVLRLDQLQFLEATPEREPFDGDPARFRLGIEAARLGLAYEYDPYFSLSISRVDPLPHQLEAVYDYFMRLPRIRFLLADDPGAGKTIMAGLLLKELKIRSLVKRTLIVAPANLCFQWQRELKEKFRETFEIVRSDVLRANYGQNPWQEKNQVITSISWVSRMGTEFDSLTGRGGKDGTPLRRTPWGDIAFQLGGEEGFAVVARHDAEGIAPSTEVIRKFLPQSKPALILMDELLNYLNRERNRKAGLGGQLYSFVQNLSEEARAQDRVVLAVSLPSIVDEMTPEDEADFQRFEKLLDRLGKAMIMSAESETSEIIRRRLFEWGGLPDDAKKTATEYADWVQAHRTQVPTWFPVDNAKEAFAATYPFHPTLLSVFERKWQALPRFQQTRGVLRLLALWVANAYQAGFKGAHKDPLVGMGTAPLDDPLFRSAIFEQLGGAKLEGAVTTDICGKMLPAA